MKSVFLTLLVFFHLEVQASQRQTVYPSVMRWGAELVTPDNMAKNKKRPLLVLLHGCKIGADDILNISEIEKFVDENDFAVIAPNQSRGVNPDNCWNFFSDVNQRPYHSSLLTPTQEGYNDVAYISHSISRAIDVANIDTRRIYIAGISSGAAMSLNSLLCDLDHNFAGVAMASGLAFGVVQDPFKADDILKNGSGLSQRDLKTRLRVCPRHIEKVKFVIVHGDKDQRINHANLDEVRMQISTNNPADANRIIIQLIPGLAHKWSGSKFKSIYSDPKTIPFTPMFLRHFGLIK